MSKQWYVVEEKVCYRIQAESEDDAINKIVRDGNRDRWFYTCDERSAYLDDEQTDA